jgi:polysaccharide pyruvyl transferase WcaK-like protein
MNNRILHLASFIGNIGDNASHFGLGNILNTISDKSPEIDKLEIRRFYKNYNLPDKLFFDETFVELTNNYDVVIIGGGGFFNFCIENSKTGTTLDFSDDIFLKIKTPIIISSMGILQHQEVPEGNLQKFENFLNLILNKDNATLALRNDGSKDIINKLFGSKYEVIPEILDNAFFYKPKKLEFPISEKKYILINITKDQIQMKNMIIGSVNYKFYLSELRKFIKKVIKESDLNIVFAPHIFSDYIAIQELLSGINEFHIRTRIIVSPHVQEDFGCNLIFNIYQKAEFIIGMRFHANVCSIAMEKKSVGLVALDRVDYLYKNMGIEDSLIFLNEPFSEILFNKLLNHMQNSSYKTEHSTILAKKKEFSLSTYKSMFKTLKLV